MLGAEDGEGFINYKSRLSFVLSFPSKITVSTLIFSLHRQSFGGTVPRRERLKKTLFEHLFRRKTSSKNFVLCNFIYNVFFLNKSKAKLNSALIQSQLFSRLSLAYEIP